MRMILLAAASLSLALAGAASAQQTSDEYPPCKTRAQDHCRVVGKMGGQHKMKHHKKMAHHKAMAHHEGADQKSTDKPEAPKT